jgi:phenol 2-monooxygenase
VPGPDGNLIRQGPFCSSKVNESPFHNMLLSQGRIEQFILDSIKQHSDLEVERGVIAECFEYDESVNDDPNAYPITVKLRTLSDDKATASNDFGGGNPQSVPDGLDRSNILSEDWDDLTIKSRSRHTKTEVVKAKYLIGCDGAHSWTRKQVDIPLEGSSTDHIWLGEPVCEYAKANMNQGRDRCNPHHRLP